jgi:RNA polymerase sigma-70 factor (ECF subfamily)
LTDLLLDEYAAVRPELHAYLCRLAVRPQLAEDLLQTTYLRCLQARDSLPPSREGVRAWLFKVASNAAFDELRRHSTWRETMLSDLRGAAEADSDFMAKTAAMASTPETRAIAREHVVCCMACVMRNFPERKSAALLLKEIHGFSVEETADLIGATQNQVKNWLQEARGALEKRYGRHCALITKDGACLQCVELDAVMQAGQGDPLLEGGDVEARLRVARGFRDVPWGKWHHLMLQLIEELD